MMQLSSKNDDSSLCYDVIITHQKIFKIGKFGDFSCDIDYNCGTNVFRDVISLIINQYDHRRPKRGSGGQCPPAAQRKQANRACS